MFWAHLCTLLKYSRTEASDRIAKPHTPAAGPCACEIVCDFGALPCDFRNGAVKPHLLAGADAQRDGCSKDVYEGLHKDEVWCLLALMRVLYKHVVTVYM